MYVSPHIDNRLSALSLAAVAAMALLSSCSNDGDDAEEIATPREITVTGNHGTNSTRADDIPLDPDYKMWVTSIYHDAKNTRHNYYLNDLLFTSKTVDSKTIWAAPGGAYYPLSGKVDFVAYASQDVVHKPEARYYTSAPLPATSGEPYLCTLDLDYRSAGLDGTDDVLVSAVTPDAPCGKEARSVVPLSFSHLLSNVRFEFAASTEEAATFMKVSSLELESFSLSGKAQLNRTKGSAWTLSWPIITDPVKVRRDIELFPAHNSSAPPVVDFFFPPQTISPATQFTINFKYSTPMAETDEMWYATTQFSSKATTFVAGKRYTYYVLCRILPMIEFNISLVDDENGIVLDQWTVEPAISL